MNAGNVTITLPLKTLETIQEALGWIAKDPNITDERINAKKELKTAMDSATIAEFSQEEKKRIAAMCHSGFEILRKKRGGLLSMTVEQQKLDEWKETMEQCQVWGGLHEPSKK